MKHITGNTYTTTIGYTDIGIYVMGNRAVLIDSGSEESEDLLTLLKKHGLTPAAIINTHLHIDHIANNQPLQKRFHCPVYCSSDEIGSEGGHVKAGPDEGDLDVYNASFRILPLHGHSIGHQAVVTPDGVCFLGDAVMCLEKLKSSKMPYHLNAGKALDSMKRILDLPYCRYVLSHYGVYDADQLQTIVKANIKKEHALLETALSLLDKKMKTDKLASLFMDSIHISRKTQDISWVSDTATARIRELEQLGKIERRNGFVRSLSPSPEHR